MTVEEAMDVAASLKLGEKTTSEEKTLVTKVMNGDSLEKMHWVP